MKILGERLRILRKEKRLRQEEVAQAIDISFTSYCRYELDERDPKAPTIVALADFFDVSADFLLGRTDVR